MPPTRSTTAAVTISRTMSSLILSLVLAVVPLHGFIPLSTTTPAKIQPRSRSVLSGVVVPTPQSHRAPYRLQATNDDSDTATAATTSTSDSNGSLSTPEQDLDELLTAGKLRQAVSFLQSTSKLDMTNDRWERIFACIESHTAAAEENQLNTRMATNDDTNSQYPLQSPARMDMTNMYGTLQEQKYLQLFGAVDSKEPPAAGSHTLTPMLLEQITKVGMKALTPKLTNNLLIAGILLAITEGLASMQLGIDFNLLVLTTLLVSFVDRLVVNGAVFESLVRVLTPGLSEKIAKHEAGHFLCAYLLGCPVEGYVLSSWAALQDARFDKRQVSAGTSFFDATLSQEYANSKLSRSSVDRYSIIVMAGIAAEALEYGRADGGAGDEMALIYFLSQLNGNSNKKQWDDVTIRNQARWGAMQAVLMMQYYKPCYTALVDVMERGGSLGDCIFAIEKAGRDHGLKPLSEPLGYILERGPYGTWSTEKPTTLLVQEQQQQQQQQQAAPNSDSNKPNKQLNEKESLEALKEYRAQMEERLREIDEKLEKL